ncbi:MAG: AMP-binding protein, partial [Candidatus Kapaibacterium sp.]
GLPQDFIRANPSTPCHLCTIPPTNDNAKKNANIVTILEQNARQFPEKIAMIEGEMSVTYREFLTNIQRRAAWFSERGIVRGDGVLIVVPMSITLYEILIALFWIGAVAVFLDAWSNRSRLELARNAFPIKGFIGVGRAHLLRLISPALRSIPLKFWVDTPGRWNESLGTPVQVMPDDPALITFTTGSTGKPKGANRTHGFLLAQHQAILNHFAPQVDDIDMPTLPIFPLSNIALGSTTFLPPVNFRDITNFKPDVLLREATRRHITTTAGSPAFFLRLATYLIERDQTFSHLREILVGGAPVFPRTARTLRRAFPDTEITIVYGSTEAEPISMISVDSLLTQAKSRHDALPVGKPVESIEIIIASIDESNLSPLPTGEVGEICVSGKHVLQEYIGDPSEWSDKMVVVEGKRWLRTGDAGCVDHEGSLYLLGRVGKSWIRSGERHFVMPVELALDEIPGVAIGTILEVEGETILLIERENNMVTTEVKIREAVRDREISFDRIEFIQRIPRDPRHASKIDYEKLREALSM